MGAARGILVALFGILVYTGSTSIVTDEHYKGNDEVGLLQVEVEAKAQNEKIEEAGLMNSKRAEGVDDDEGKDKEKAAEQESKVHFNQHGDEGVDALKLITKDEVDGHQFLPAEMLLKNVEKLADEYGQPLAQTDPALQEDVEDFAEYLHWILRQMLDNRKEKLDELDALKQAIVDVGGAGSTVDVAVLQTSSGSTMTSLDTRYAACQACDDDNNEPVAATADCDSLWAFKQEIIGHVCGDNAGAQHICDQNNVPVADQTATDAEWLTFIQGRSPHCAFYDRTSRGYTSVYAEWTALNTACNNEISQNGINLNNYLDACDTSYSTYKQELCAWRNHLIEECTVALNQAWNSAASAYAMARRAWICPDRALNGAGECLLDSGAVNTGTLDAQWNAEYITIKKLMCYMKVWLGNDHTNADEVMRDAHLTDDTHQADTVLACQNAIYDPNDMNTLTFDTPEHVAGGFSEESITVDLRPHLPEPDFTSSCDSASGNCLTSVRNCDTSQANNFDRWSNSYEDYLQTCIDNHAPQPEVTCGFGDLTNR
eukprot:gnl/TRDRNA2_/TRDRNA2_161444_c0_seq13.p1 gnl/TRDRNA2_/TRDRNA2_161444_c0~~gnl/TRDRNA2_/TRDRNA2_161444_c0_seq13.p1  ORF type:complete len:542 (-),score=80.68 gnl/TRDRNA2_/TRDRNA2_161444_c0_seq13:161-1786(-)